MSIPSAELPGIFNFEEVHKGLFPHAFHISENLNYRGPIPAKHYFQPQTMMPKKNYKEETEGAPIKNYNYKLQNGKTECKIRGFTLDEQGSALLKFESMKHILAEIYDPEKGRRTIGVPLSINFE